jgi:hypothetical protein
MKVTRFGMVPAGAVTLWRAAAGARTANLVRTALRPLLEIWGLGCVMFLVMHPRG